MATFYAHRGAPAELPENTLPGFARALELGADVLETDVHMTRDGHVVVSHDPSLLRSAGVAVDLRRSTLAEVRRWDVGWGHVDAKGGRPYAGGDFRVPTLEEVLATFPDARFNVDAKQSSPPMVPLRRLKGASCRTMVPMPSLRSLKFLQCQVMLMWK